MIAKIPMNILSVKYDFHVSIGKFRLARKARIVEFETLDYSYDWKYLSLSNSYLYKTFESKIELWNDTQKQKTTLSSNSVWFSRKDFSKDY